MPYYDSEMLGENYGYYRVSCDLQRLKLACLILAAPFQRSVQSRQEALFIWSLAHVKQVT